MPVVSWKKVHWKSGLVFECEGAENERLQSVWGDTSFGSLWQGNAAITETGWDNFSEYRKPSGRYLGAYGTDCFMGADG